MDLAIGEGGGVSRLRILKRSSALHVLHKNKTIPCGQSTYVVNVTDNLHFMFCCPSFHA